VEVKVSDNGIGIRPEHLGKIFEPFFTTKPEGQGTGLGLSIVKDIVTRHRGEVRVQSRSGEGAEFTVSLPRWKAGPARQNPEPTPAGAGKRREP